MITEAMTTTTQTATVSLKRAAIPLLLGALVVLGVMTVRKALAPFTNKSAPDNSAAVEPEACRLVLTPLGGDKPIDQEIARQQALVRKGSSSAATLERLGWTFGKKPRLSFDP